MQGRRALWIPGTDHAGLATQEKLDAAMRERGLDPEGPDFSAFSEEWKKSYQGRITNQLHSLGASCDWERERFTLDERYGHAVNEAMHRFHEAGMLSRRDDNLYLDMTEPARLLLRHLDAGRITIRPENAEKTLRHFLDNIEPWCISRRIRWGHPIPLMTSADGTMRVDTKALPGETREEGVLDTWFSSALWPFAALGWPENTSDMRDFYPADLIETGDDILFFWCARMLMTGEFLTGELPFREIFLHGIIRDEQGRKFSKSLGNGIDPLIVIREHGTDALRMAILENTTAGQDSRWHNDAVLSARALRTKLWNGARFILNAYEKAGCPPFPHTITRPDTLLLREHTAEAARTSAIALEARDFRGYAACIRRLIHDRLCSVHIETFKEGLRNGDTEGAAALAHALSETLKLAHPAMPFITERIWSAFSDNTTLISARWPDV